MFRYCFFLPSSAARDAWLHALLSASFSHRWESASTQKSKSTLWTLAAYSVALRVPWPFPEQSPRGPLEAFPTCGVAGLCNFLVVLLREPKWVGSVKLKRIYSCLWLIKQGTSGKKLLWEPWPHPTSFQRIIRGGNSLMLKILLVMFLSNFSTTKMECKMSVWGNNHLFY